MGYGQRNFGTAHVYRSTLNIVTTFHGSKYLDFHQVNPEWLKDFEVYLRSRGSSWNTVSTYLRVLRAVYNRAVDLRKSGIYPAFIPFCLHRNTCRQEACAGR